MAAETAGVERALGAIGTTFRLMRLYPPTHPAVVEALKQIGEALPGLAALGTVEWKVGVTGLHRHDGAVDRRGGPHPDGRKARQCRLPARRVAGRCGSEAGRDRARERRNARGAGRRGREARRARPPAVGVARRRHRGGCDRGARPPAPDGKRSEGRAGDRPGGGRALRAWPGRALGAPARGGARAPPGARGGPDGAVRAAAVRAVAAAGDPTSSTVLVRRVEQEADEGVQAELLRAIGRLGARDALDVLARYAEPGGMMHRRSATVRAAAVDGLRHIARPEARGLLELYSKDKEPAVRKAAEAGLK